MMQARNYFRTKFRKTGNQEDWINYKNLKRRVINLTRKAKAEYFTNLVKTIGAHPGKAWSRLNAAIGRKSKRQTISLRMDSGMITSKSEIVQTFSTHFSTIANSLPSAQPQQLSASGSRFQFTTIENEMVLELLTTLDERKAAGPDGISARVLKMVVNSSSTI